MVDPKRRASSHGHYTAKGVSWGALMPDADKLWLADLAKQRLG
ncbi:MAG: hypothetical protein ABI824_07310 [Acidobacteriota bacterium]